MSDTERMVGETVEGKYRIDRLIGRGGMGAVYAGTHLQLERPVAIKVVRADLLSDTVAATRFMREAKTAARIEHPNAVHVYDFGSLPGGGAFLVMEYIDGVSLRELLRDRLPLDPSTAFTFIRQAASAVHAAHARGVVHRDLKPENMMVGRDDEGQPVLKVVDFGIAKLLESETATNLTDPGGVIGTPKYMAPEQFSGEAADARADVYALGVVLYELLTGRPPFEGQITEIIGKQLHATPPTFEALGVGLPEAVERVVARTLAKDPSERIQTAAQLVRELGEAFAESGLPVESYARPDPSTGRTPSGSFATRGTPSRPTDPTGLAGDEQHVGQISLASGPVGQTSLASPEAFETRSAPLDGNADAFATRYGAEDEDEATRVRPNRTAPTIKMEDRRAGAEPGADPEAGRVPTLSPTSPPVPLTRRLDAPPAPEGHARRIATVGLSIVVAGGVGLFVWKNAVSGPTAPPAQPAAAPSMGPMQPATPPVVPPTITAPAPAPAQPADATPPIPGGPAQQAGAPPAHAPRPEPARPEPPRTPTTRIEPPQAVDPMPAPLPPYPGRDGIDPVRAAEKERRREAREARREAWEANHPFRRKRGY